MVHSTLPRNDSVDSQRSHQDRSVPEEAAHISTSKNQSEGACSRSMNAFYAEAAGVFGRILIERCFFQNTNVPLETLLYLGNDVIKALSFEPEGNVFNMAKEISLMWKEWKGEVLSAQEKLYLDSPKQIDVFAEVVNGLKYSTLALIGQSWYTSVTSAAQNRLWSHVPAICAYSGAAIAGGQSVAVAVERVLSRSNLSDESKSLVQPWMNTIGRLALGFIPKVHATEEGVHYHFPATDGWSRTVSQGQAVTVYGNDLSIERDGTLHTPEGSFEGGYAANFRLTEIQQLTEEIITIKVVADDGIEVPVEFKSIRGLYGPEISVHCDNQEIQKHWSQYFTKIPSTVDEHPAMAFDVLNRLAVSNLPSAILPACSALTALAATRRLSSSYASMAVGVAALNLPKSVEGLGPIAALVPVFAQAAGTAVTAFKAKKFAQGQWKEARITLDYGFDRFDSSVVQVENSAKRTIYELENGARLILQDSLLIAQEIEEGVEAVLRVGGEETRLTIQAASEEALVVIRELKEAEESFWGHMVEYAPEAVRRSVREGLEEIQSAFITRTPHDQRLVDMISRLQRGNRHERKNSVFKELKQLEDLPFSESSGFNKACLYSELIKYVARDCDLSLADKSWLTLAIASVAYRDFSLKETTSQLFGLYTQDVDYFGDVLKAISSVAVKTAFTSDFETARASVIKYLYHSAQPTRIEAKYFPWGEVETASILRGLAFMECSEEGVRSNREFFAAFNSFFSSVDLRYRGQVADIAHELAEDLVLISRHAEAKELYLDLLKVHEESGEGRLEKAAIIKIQIGNAFLRESDTQQALKYLKEGLQALDVCCEGAHKSAIDANLEMGHIYKDAGRFEEAEQYFEAAKKVSGGLFGPGSLQFAVCLYEMGQLFEIQGKLPGAIKKFEHALEIIELSPAGQEQKLVSMYRHLIAMFKKLERLDDAEASINKLQEASKRLFGTDSAEFAGTLQEAGDFLLCQGRAEEAATKFEEALGILKTAIGQKNSAVMDAYVTVSKAYSKLERFKDAWENIVAAQSLAEELFGRESLEFAKTSEEMGHLLFAQGHFMRALEKFQDAEVIFSECDKSAQKRIGNSIHTGETYKKLNDLEAAQKCFEAAKTTAREYFGSASLEFANSSEKLGTFLRDRGNQEGALTELQDALGIYREHLGESHPIVARNYHHLGHTHNTLGKRDEAKFCFRQAKDIYLVVSGPRSPEVAEQFEGLGHVYAAERNHHEALANFSRALEIFQSNFGDEHTATARNYGHVGHCYHGVGQRDEGNSYFRRALDLFLKLGDEGQVAYFREALNR